MKRRHDAWTPEDDLLLAETVLRYIREGGTQLAAFEEVANKLNRTPAACGFRWNAEVRKQYTEAIELAKKQRKEHKKSPEKQKKHIISKVSPHAPANEQLTSSEDTNSSCFSPHPITVDQCILFLQGLKQSYEQSHTLFEENKRLKMENEELRLRNSKLGEKLRKISQTQQSVQEDYEMLIKIIKRAQELSREEGISPQPLN